MSRQLRYIGFFISLVAAIVFAWQLEYSGEPIGVKAGTVVSAQQVRRKHARLARVKTVSGQTVKADCQGRRQGERVELLETRGRLSGDSVYRCR